MAISLTKLRVLFDVSRWDFHPHSPAVMPHALYLTGIAIELTTSGAMPRSYVNSSGDKVSEHLCLRWSPWSQCRWLLRPSHVSKLTKRNTVTLQPSACGSYVHTLGFIVWMTAHIYQPWAGFEPASEVFGRPHLRL